MINGIKKFTIFDYILNGINKGTLKAKSTLYPIPRQNATNTDIVSQVTIGELRINLFSLDGKLIQTNVRVQSVVGLFRKPVLHALQ